MSRSIEFTVFRDFAFETQARDSEIRLRLNTTCLWMPEVPVIQRGHCLPPPFAQSAIPTSSCHGPW